MAHRFDTPEGLAGHVAQQVAQAVRAGERVCVGFSGGLDSTALLDLLAGLRERGGFALEAMHVHHGLSPNADRWASSCGEFARRLGVPIRIERVRVARDDPSGLEAAARRARREALARAGAPVVALAHHRDDQAETVLLQALRGTGLKGLAGMGPVHEALGVRWVRPFLEVPRTAIAAYARARSLAWVEDESNASREIDRNFLRHEGLAVLSSRFAQAGGSLARLARHAASAGRLLEALARLDAGGALESPSLAAAPLRALPPERAANVLRHWIEAHGGAMPGEARLAQIRRQLLEARRDAQVRIRHEGFLLARHGDFLVLEPDGNAPGVWDVAWRGEAIVALGEALGEVRFESRAGAGIDASLVTQGTWHFSTRRGGERIRLEPGRPTRTLKNLLQEGRIPAWRRERLPLLFEGERLVWVPGIGISADHLAPPGERGLEPHWTPAGSPEKGLRP